MKRQDGKPQAQTNGAPAPAAMVSLGELPIALARDPRAAPVYKTVRVIDLARLRTALKRRLRKDAHLPLAARLARLLKVLDRLQALDPDGLPEVAVVHNETSGQIQTNFAVLSDIIFLGAHLSPSWVEGTESDAALDALAEALELHERRQARGYQPTSVTGATGKL